MKAIATACAVLLLAGACKPEDTSGGGVWGRTVEPRLTTTRSWHVCTPELSPDRAVAQARCAAPPLLKGRCDDVVNSYDEATAMLVSRPQCTDAAIAALERFSRDDAAALSDLAAAYYVRAQRKDDPADLLLAFDAAQRAVAMKPQPPGAQFNAALILQALSLNDDAIDAWQRAAAVEKGEWADEARGRHAELKRAMTQNQWPQVRAQIDAALDAHDVVSTRSLIALFPATAQKHFEEDVIPQWGNVAQVTTFAEALSQFFNDNYFRDVAAKIVHAPSPALREGHLRFAQARAAEASLGPGTAAPLYEQAARLLREAGSPQQLLARIGHAGQIPFVTDRYEPSRRELDAVAAAGPSYPSVIARVELSRLNVDQFLDRYDALFRAYEAAMTAYGRVGDWEDCDAARARALSAMTVVGLKERVWREAFAAVRDAPRLQDSKTRHLLLGTAARAALNLGYPELALRYQTIAVNTAPNTAHLAIALSERALIQLRLQRYDDAQRDLDSAVRANKKLVDDSARHVVEARLVEVQGERTLQVDPKQAVQTFTQAIDLASNAEYTSFRAMLFAQRAEAYRRSGRLAEAEADMRQSLALLHGEEEGMLGGRKRGQDDDLWNAYFSRFEETYDLLIRQLIGQSRFDEAFRYAERARAYEPLDLVRKLPAAPKAFRALAADPDHLDIGKLSEQLPPGTFLIEYRVFDDRTYAWILGRGLFTGQWLKAGSGDVKRWTSALQNGSSNKEAFEAALEPAYEALLKGPLESIGSATRIVIVPDRHLRGLSFAALRNPDTKPKRYVIEDRVISMSGSALLYVFALLRDRDLAPDTSALLVADPAFNQHSTLGQGWQRLLFARREAELIRGLYGSPQILSDKAATPEEFLRLAGNRAVIHIAAHGVVNGGAPSQSYLLFNGVLNAEMLMNGLHTDRTRLVVLGACSSAGGLPVGAEGIAPLVRPIVAAGVPGVVGALWDINDATTADLLVSFHRHYRQGDDAATALRKAQLEMLRSDNPGKTPARIWAPFQAIGYASSPFASMGDITKEKPP
ncbi:MAG TPA: CHAT domain-containing protein [Thermoanaerobaculia bacterium]|nr:CHAT domain-containing protein [Thermoanaerobaculia bacterium]